MPYVQWRFVETAVWIRAWMSNYTPHIRMDVTIHPCRNICLFLMSRGDFKLFIILIRSDPVASWWWRHQMETFPRNWPFVRGINRSPVNSPRKGQWSGALISLWSAPEKTVEQTNETPVIWDVIALIMTCVMCVCMCEPTVKKSPPSVHVASNKERVEDRIPRALVPVVRNASGTQRFKRSRLENRLVKCGALSVKYGVALKGHHYAHFSFLKKMTCVKISCDYVYIIILHVCIDILHVYIIKYTRIHNQVYMYT